jgi:S-formylglutathione hydrolase FrmB
MKLRIISTIAFFVLTIIPNTFGQNTGTVKVYTYFSNSLGINKNFYIYLPAGYDTSTAHYPVVYFLRTHESEWFDSNAPGRNGKTLKDVADSLINNGLIGKIIIVGPSTGGTNAWPGLVNMLRPDLAQDQGIGTGQFEDYFIQDLIPYIDANFRTIPEREHRGIDGFSFGGFCSIIYSFRNPGQFCSVGSYDGTMMWCNLDDPAIPGSDPDDPFWISPPFPWMESGLASMFDSPRNIPYMLQHSATNILADANTAKLDSIRSIKFHVHTVYADSVGNYSRNLQLTDSMASYGLLNTFSDIILASDAIHDYGFADLHASKSLIKHWETFQLNVPVELTSFSANVSGKGNVILNWRTATEVNNQMFEIERRSKDNQFITIGYVEGYGTTTEPQEYSYLDETVETGTYIYRLKQIDFGGQYEFSNKIEVEVNGPLTFALEQNYPNPFNPSTSIKYSVAENGFVKLSVFNLVGEEVSVLVNETVDAGFYQVTFYATNLPSGTYFYRLENSGSVQVKKMMLLK